MAIREGTTNILRHARAERAWIQVNGGSGNLVLEIRNDGAVGKAVPGTGLRHLAERAAARDGIATGSVLPGGEFALTVSLAEKEPV
jgi:two-component system sensor histidine kinase DesK